MDDLIIKEQARADAYRLLAACFCQPEKDLFLDEEVFSGLTENMRQLYPAAAEEAARMQTDFSNIEQEELLVEYAHLFVGPHELVAPPYGSVYLDGQGEVMGPSTREVMRIYQEEGLALDEGFNDLPDHITAELEFLYYLIVCEIKALQSGDALEAVRLIEKQRDFLDKYVLKWVPEFCDRITVGTTLAYYRSLSACLGMFLLQFEASISIPGSLMASIENESNNAKT
jgi:TorA maturation chaperone TorD